MGEWRRAMEKLVNSKESGKRMLEFYKDKRVFVSGHTGFKGSWLCRMLLLSGAQVTGFAMEPPKDSPSLFALAGIEQDMHSIHGDIRDFSALKRAFDAAQPEIVFHLAAQPIVRKGYACPVYTYETNIMGTVHMLECARMAGCVRSFVNVTTDKVYDNQEWCWGYRETDALDGFDPYSNSKSCSELVTHSYIRSFFAGSDTAISTVRAGNVIGGGDFAPLRIVPDCIRALQTGTPIEVRNPQSVRPYQHVLEALNAYLLIAEKQYKAPALAGSYNVGPDECDCITTGELVDLFIQASHGELKRMDMPDDNAVHEASFLRLDTSKLKRVFTWKPRWNISEAIQRTLEWSQCYFSGGNTVNCMNEQIAAYYACEKNM